jgi:negative regulator of flagellin synthesis FlgM
VSNNIKDLGGSGPGAGASLGTSRTSAAVPANTGGTAAESADSAGRDVHITDTATWLANLESQLRESPAVDTAKVASIRTAIEQGQYTVRPEHVAAQLSQMEHALSKLQPGPNAAPLPRAPDEES